MVAAQKNSGPITRSYRTAELQPGLLFSFSQLRHDLVQVEAGCFLSLRIVPESRQELAHVIRGGNTTNCPRAPIKTGLGCLTRRTKSRTAISVPAISMSTKMPVGIPRST